MFPPQEQLYYVVYDSLGVPRLVPVDMTNSSFVENGVTPTQSVFGNGNIGPFLDNNVSGALGSLSDLHQNVLATKEAIAVGANNPNNKRTFVRKPWLDAPDGAVPFDPAAAFGVPSIGNGVIIVNHTVPEGYDGVINAYSWNITNPNFIDGDGSLVAQMLRNGVPIRNYNDITVQKGCIQIPRPIAPLRIYSKQTISIVVLNVSSVLTGNLVASLVGYDYPSEG